MKHIKIFFSFAIFLIVISFTITPINSFIANASSTATLKTFLAVSTTATNVLDSNAPREVTLDAPQKYINSVEVIHKKGGTFSTNIGDSLSITNIDVITTGSNVQAVKVEAGSAPVKTMKRFDSNSGDTEQKYQIGFSSLPDADFDITITVYNSAVTFNDSTLIETKTFKVPVGSDPIYKVNEPFTYETAGETYTLYDLLSDLNLFKNLLSEHEIDDLYIEY